MDSDRFTLDYAIPPVEDYLRLRTITGLTPHDRASAEAGLPASMVAVTVRENGTIVGIGRAVGDGALFVQIVDIAVDPACQGQGLGTAIMAALMTRLEQILPGKAYVSLIADGEAHRLYRRFGFDEVWPDSRGMAMWLRRRG